MNQPSSQPQQPTIRPDVGCEGDSNVSEEAHSPHRGEFSGFFKLHRRFFNHYLWQEHRDFSRAEAFLDLLQLAAYAHTKRLVKGTLLELSPGQLCGSERYLASRWNWSTKKVRNFLAMLEADRMVNCEKKREGSVITLVNYASYSDAPTTKEAPKTHRGSTLEAPRKQIKEEEEEEKNIPPYPPKGGERPPPRNKKPHHPQEAPDLFESIDQCADKPTEPTEPTEPTDQDAPPHPGRILPPNWQKMPERERKRQRCLRNSEAMIRIGQFFGRQPDTLWTVSEAAALHLVKPNPEEVATLESYYERAIPSDLDYRRRDLATLLNNWNTELDRAKSYKANNP